MHNDKSKTHQVKHCRLCSQNGFDKNLFGGYSILVIDCTAKSNCGDSRYILTHGEVSLSTNQNTQN